MALVRWAHEVSNLVTRAWAGEIVTRAWGRKTQRAQWLAGDPRPHLHTKQQQPTGVRGRFPGAPLPGHRAECPAHERSLGLRLAVSTAGNGRPPEPQSAARAGRNSDGSQRGGVCAGKASAGAAG